MLQKVMGSCALGAVIGSLVAIQLAVFWPLGVFAGALVGYLSIEFRAVIAAFKTAWKVTIVWRPSPTLWLKVLWAASEGIAGFALALTLTFAISFLCFFGRGLEEHSIGDIVMFSFGMSLMFGIFFFLVSLLRPPSENERKEILLNMEFALEINPIAVLVYWPVRGLIRSIRRWRSIVRAAAYVGMLPIRFLRKVIALLWKTFRLIHSDLRLLCAVDAAIGAYVGYRLGNPLIGGLAGGLWGGVNYWLVAIKWLKLAPKI